MLQADSLADQKQIAEKIPLQMWQEATTAPVGQVYQTVAFRCRLLGRSPAS